MNEQEMKVALGILVDAMTDAAWDGHNMDGAELQDLLTKTGLTTLGPATVEDIKNSQYGDFSQPGDEWHVLTPFAIECRSLARGSRLK